MAKFKVGDRIRMNMRANDRYGYSKENSIGVITVVKFGEHPLYTVMFETLTGDPSRSVPDTFPNIAEDTMDLIEDYIAGWQDLNGGDQKCH